MAFEIIRSIAYLIQIIHAIFGKNIILNYIFIFFLVENFIGFASLLFLCMTLRA